MLNLKFTIPQYPGQCHVRDKFYLAGGQIGSDKINNFIRISDEGNFDELKSLPTAKAGFPIAFWLPKNTMITIGGCTPEILR